MPVTVDQTMSRAIADIAKRNGLSEQQATNLVLAAGLKVAAQQDPSLSSATMAAQAELQKQQMLMNSMTGSLSSNGSAMISAIRNLR
jgi:hypothetical protein